MKQTEKIKALQDNHFSEWLKTRQEVEDVISRGQTMFCICGKLATGLHERTCRKFHAKVNTETAKRLKHLVK